MAIDTAVSGTDVERLKAVDAVLDAVGSKLEQQASRGADRSLSVADVLEEELCALTGDASPAALVWDFAPEHIVEAEALRTRLVEERDPVARGLAQAELKALAIGLREQGAPRSDAQRATLREVLASALNTLLDLPELCAGEGAARFANVRFRDQTRDAIAMGSVRERNRLVLEDAFPQLQRRDELRLAEHHARAHRARLSALCLSGGGIRSASFAMGVVQGLARLGLLPRFHYLSTVSGGGYLGGWLSAWIHRAGPERVERALAGGAVRALEPEPEPLAHMRAHSSYLSPRLGVDSADAWTLAAIYLRNLLLNWCVFVPLLAAVLALPQLLLSVVRLAQRESALPQPIVGGVFLALLAGGIACVALAMRHVHATRPRVRDEAAPLPGFGVDRPGAFVRWCLLPMLGASVALVTAWAWIASGKLPWLLLAGGPGAWTVAFTHDAVSVAAHAAWFGAIGGVVTGFAGWLYAWRFVDVRSLPFALAGGALLGVVAIAIVNGLVPTEAARSIERLEQYAWYVTFAVPALLAAVLVLGHLVLGLSSANRSESLIEWSARYSAWLQIAICAWIAVCGIVVLLPLGVGWSLDRVADRDLGEVIAWIGGALSTAAGVFALSQVYAAPLGQASGAGARPDARALLVRTLAMPVFLVALFAAMSFLVGWLMDLPETLFPVLRDASCAPADASVAAAHYPRALRAVVCGSIPSALLVVIGLVAVGLVLSLRIDTNRFSLHGMYRTRLVRTFLGASRGAHERSPNGITGFDERDDLPLAGLWQRERRAPLHVVNAALNLMRRDELAHQQRKATSFTFSPLHCGAAHLGYRRSRDYAGGVTLGTAITISGAAASPEMGYHSKPLLSFLLALFNIRLGWWLGNTGHAGRHHWREAAPASSARPLIDEALGRTDDRNAQVYLSDGGHFENLGLYEMVRRRCHWIVVSDAGCDPLASFEDLGNAIRRIRVDFGIPVEFAGVPIRARGDDGARRSGATYCAIGRIRYSAVDGEVEDGILVYLKPAFYGSEPPDVYNFGRANPSFPHESTANQFFTEAQFESYRRLGAYVIEYVVGDVRLAGDRPGAQDPEPRAHAPGLDALVRSVEAHLQRGVAPPEHATG